MGTTFLEAVDSLNHFIQGSVILGLAGGVVGGIVLGFLKIEEAKQLKSRLSGGRREERTTYQTQRTYKILHDRKTQTILVPCPICHEEFNCDMNPNDPESKKALACPHCGVKSTMSVTVTGWRCDYCDKPFDDKAKCEEHELRCGAIT